MMRVTRNYMSALMNSNLNTRRGSMYNRLQTNQSWFPGLQTTNKTSSTQTTYLNMKNSAGGVQKTASELTDTSEDSLFAKAKESGDTSAIVDKVKEFVTQYNNMVKSLRSGNSRVDNSYLNQMNSYAQMFKSGMQATGVTKQADGTLKVDDKALRSASVEQLEKTWGNSSTSFAAKAETVSVNVQANAVTSMNSLISNSYSNLLSSFGSRGNFFNTMWV